MRALSVRQPGAELFLRGLKPIEYRNRPTRIIGETFYISAAMKPGDRGGFAKLGWDDLPTGVLVGRAEIAKCTGANSGYEWRGEGSEAEPP